MNHELPRVEVLTQVEDYRFGSLFRVIRAQLRYRRFDGTMSAPVTRINFERGDSVAVLLHDPEDDAVILVRQFRYPVYDGLDPDAREGDGAQRAWLLEIVAGVQDEGRSVREVAHSELLEEAGYAIAGELEPITTVYPSPGGSSERTHLFLARVDRRQRAGAGGGVVAEGEDTQIVIAPLAVALAMVARGDICDAKTIIALQYLALRKAGKTQGHDD